MVVVCSIAWLLLSFYYCRQICALFFVHCYYSLTFKSIFNACAIIIRKTWTLQLLLNSVKLFSSAVLSFQFTLFYYIKITSSIVKLMRWKNVNCMSDANLFVVQHRNHIYHKLSSLLHTHARAYTWCDSIFGIRFLHLDAINYFDWKINRVSQWYVMWFMMLILHTMTDSNLISFEFQAKCELCL